MRKTYGLHNDFDSLSFFFVSMAALKEKNYNDIQKFNVDNFCQ